MSGNVRMHLRGRGRGDLYLHDTAFTLGLEGAGRVVLAVSIRSEEGSVVCEDIAIGLIVDALS